MNFKYRCRGHEITVWRWNTEFHPNVEVELGNKRIPKTIQEDEGGRFFTWDKEKIYLEDWIRVSMSEFKKKFENGDWLTSDDLCRSIKTDGAGNVRFKVPMNIIQVSIPGIIQVTNGECKTVLCTIIEDWNRKIFDGYKLRLVPVEDEEVESYHDFYTADFFSMIKAGVVTIEDTVKGDDVNE